MIKRYTAITTSYDSIHKFYLQVPLRLGSCPIENLIRTNNDYSGESLFRFKYGRNKLGDYKRYLKYSKNSDYIEFSNTPISRDIINSLALPWGDYIEFNPWLEIMPDIRAWVEYKKIGFHRVWKTSWDNYEFTGIRNFILNNNSYLSHNIDGPKFFNEYSPNTIRSFYTDMDLPEYIENRVISIGSKHLGTYFKEHCFKFQVDELLSILRVQNLGRYAEYCG
jgi:hypothetical protein